jgi:hypothetical protein
MHDQVINRMGQSVVTSVTNLDLHDISRTCATYGVRQFTVLTPLEDQRALVGRIFEHWQKGVARKEHPDRAAALSLLRVVSGVEALDPEAKWIVTDARPSEGAVSYASMREEIRASSSRWILMLGTGWGLNRALMDQAYRRLEPIRSVREDGYNHLSVRAAAAVMMDRLFGER